MNQVKPIVICLTPVKNEEWILDLFLQCTSLWADHIIIADQGSTDNSVSIAKKYPKVTVINNDQNEYHEYGRQQLLLNKSREFEGEKLLIALDADEFFTSNLFENGEWEKMMNAEKGTVFSFTRAQLNPKLSKYVMDTTEYPIAFMDDGSDHNSHNIVHNPRIPIPSIHKIILQEQTSILHFSTVDVARARSRVRWHMCFDKIKYNQISLTINRRYLNVFDFSHASSIPDEWFAGYDDKGIEISKFNQEDSVGATKSVQPMDLDFWWDNEVFEFIQTHGAKLFVGLEIWDKDWTRFAERSGRNNMGFSERPQKFPFNIFLSWIKVTQKTKNTYIVKTIDKLVYKILTFIE